MKNDKIYYESNEHGWCFTECKVVKGCMIGSVGCRNCKNHITHGKKYKYVRCKIFYDAVNGK